MSGLLSACAWLVCGLHLRLASYTWYLGALTLMSRRKAPAVPHPPLPHFVVVVPAHNEAHHIRTTVQSILALDYPRSSYRILVVADNCQDNTASLAEQAGAEVLVRHDAHLRGKGYALDAAFHHLSQSTDWQAVVIVDADTVISEKLLQAFAGAMQQGALAMQADYGVANGQQSWRTRLMVIALSMFHRVRSLGREQLQLSCGFRGNGMCLTRQVLVQVPYQAYGLVEDVEYGIALGKAGIRIVYVDEAQVWGEMVSSAQASQSQRLRWEQGRANLEQVIFPPLIKQAWQTRSWLLADLAYDIYVPPLARIVLLTLGLGGATLAVWGLQQGPVAWVVGLMLSHLIALTAYGLRGIALSGLGWQAWSALLWAPVYVVWKMTLGRRGQQQPATWIRTAREGEPQANDSGKADTSPTSEPRR